MKKIKLTIPGQFIGYRLDQYLKERFGDKYSRSFIQKLIRESLVLINGYPAKPHLELKGREKIEVNLPEDKKRKLEAEPVPLSIIYEDDYLLVVDKPPGMVVHPASGNFNGTLVNALLHYTENLSKVAGPLKPGIVHRLDKDTSGLLVVAKDDETHKDLARQFKNRTVKRKYIALVYGVVQLDRGIIDIPIGRSQSNRKKMDVDYLSKKDAITYYNVLKRFKNSTLMELNIRTGRSHQIRVHLKYIGYPIIGDRRYGIKKDAPRQMLHAKVLGFVHPKTNKYIEFNSLIPEDMNNYINRLSR